MNAFSGPRTASFVACAFPCAFRPLRLERLPEELRERRQARGPYDGLLRHYQLLPEEAPVAGDAAPEANLSYKQRRRQKKLDKKLYRDVGAVRRLLSASEVRRLPQFATREGREKWAASKPEHSHLTMGETAEMVRNGDYSNFENLDGVMRNLAAGKALQEMLANNPDVETASPEELCGRIRRTGEGVSALLNPALRLGLSLAQQTGHFSAALREKLQKLDEAMSTAVMTETLTHRPDRERVVEDIRAKQPRLSEEKAQAAAGALMEQFPAASLEIPLLAASSAGLAERLLGSAGERKPLIHAVLER